jgi:purine-binding chemotaxis protein CheW
VKAHLIIGSDEARFALPIEPVRSVVRIERFTRMPEAPAHLLGLVALRGEIAPAYCLARMLDADAPMRGAGAIAVAIDSSEGPFALIVDEVEGVEDIDDADIRALGPRTSIEGARVGGAVVRRAEGIAPIIDVEGVAEFDFARNAAQRLKSGDRS